MGRVLESLNELVFQAEPNILMHPFHMVGVAGVFGGSLFSAMHDMVTAHGYFGRLLFQYAYFSNSRALHFFLAIWPVVGIWLTALWISTMAFNLNGFHFNRHPRSTAVIDPRAPLLS